MNLLLQGSRLHKPYFEPLVIQDQTYCLNHLNPFQLVLPSERARKDLRIHVRFTNHAFTSAYDAAAHDPAYPIIMDHGGRPRSFCELRYTLSHTLPGVISGFTHPATKVHQTAAQRNWAHVTQIETPKGPYYVFFELRRARKEDRHLQDLHLVVESAYPQDPSMPVPQLSGRMAFGLLCSKVYAGEPVSTRR
ncbi:hypothetical protein [Metapseudomonas otitidis]|uniref:hypothetical protein n=1 Tax=Metapseudomonas otitidis TaxID=319939 RepID=UPI0026302947|nr:hypothetical protein [Pseudomonas otitidis]